MLKRKLLLLMVLVWANSLIAQNTLTQNIEKARFEAIRSTVEVLTNSGPFNTRYDGDYKKLTAFGKGHLDNAAELIDKWSKFQIDSAVSTREITFNHFKDTIKHYADSIYAVDSIHKTHRIDSKKFKKYIAFIKSLGINTGENGPSVSPDSVQYLLILGIITIFLLVIIIIILRWLALGIKRIAAKMERETSEGDEVNNNMEIRKQKGEDVEIVKNVEGKPWQRIWLYKLKTRNKANEGTADRSTATTDDIKAQLDERRDTKENLSQTADAHIQELQQKLAAAELKVAELTANFGQAPNYNDTGKAGESVESLKGQLISRESDYNQLCDELFSAKKERDEALQEMKNASKKKHEVLQANEELMVAIGNLEKELEKVQKEYEAQNNGLHNYRSEPTRQLAADRPAGLIKYAKSADAGDAFTADYLQDEPDSETIFEILVSSVTEAEYWVTTNINAQRYALTNPSFYFRKTCKYDTEPAGTILTNEPGKLQKEGSKWRIIAPAKISFIKE